MDHAAEAQKLIDYLNENGLKIPPKEFNRLGRKAAEHTAAINTQALQTRRGDRWIRIKDMICRWTPVVILVAAGIAMAIRLQTP